MNPYEFIRDRLREQPCCGEVDGVGTCMAPACTFGAVLKYYDRVFSEHLAKKESVKEPSILDATLSKYPWLEHDDWDEQ